MWCGSLRSSELLNKPEMASDTLQEEVSCLMKLMKYAAVHKNGKVGKSIKQASVAPNRLLGILDMSLLMDRL